jgi:hypothetical protein
MMNMFTFFRRFIEKLAKENKQQFQGQTPDCCTINQPKAKPAHCEKKREED